MGADKSQRGVPRRTGILLLLLLLGLCLDSRPALAGPNLARFPKHPATAPAMRYARLGRRACLRALKQRHIDYTPVSKAPGVLAPVRLRGKLEGVLFRTDYPPKMRRKVPWEVFDCRLVLALDDFTRILKAHDIDEVRIFSAWRPPSRHWPEGKIARRHPGALAVDVRVLKKKSGQELVVEHDFHGRIGAETCGPDADSPDPATPEARELRSIVCEASDARIFNSILTPDYNKPHHNHFHLEVTAGVKWFITH